MKSLFLNSRRLFWKYSIVCLLWIVLISYGTLNLSNIHNTNKSVCHAGNETERNKIEKFLEPKFIAIGNILDDDESLMSDLNQNIFLLETHMDEVRILDNARQACSVESADAKISFILTTNSSGISLKYTDIAHALLSYENIHIRYLNPHEFSKGTVIEHLVESNAVLSSKYPIEHMADVMRVLLLYKYTGLYLDLDIFSLTSLVSLNYTNFACPEDVNIITNAVLNVDKNGRKVMELYLHKLNSSYDGSSWGVNGLAMLSVSIRSFCNNKNITKNELTICDEFTILPVQKCYPLEYDDYYNFYLPEGKMKALEKIKHSNAYFVHIWNKMLDFGNQKFPLTFESDSAYIELAKALCPKVLKTIEKYF
ncbi:hypothetical protein ACKWTF_015723 [Chironomus riparius]